MYLKTILATVLSLSVIASAEAGWGNGGQGYGRNQNQGQGQGQSQGQSLNPNEAAQLSYLREEEKVARDVYLQMSARWGLPVFDNISSAEQNHMNAVLNLLSQYGQIDPAQPQTGLFTDAGLQSLYDTLVGQGSESLLQALVTGALIEEVDMQDLDRMIASTEKEDLIALYEKLHCGSRNHLRAFVRQIESRGVVYTAQVLSQEAVDAIVDTPMERRCGAAY